MRQKLIINIEMKKGYEDLLPRYHSPGASGVDLHAAIEEPEVIGHGEYKLIPTGVRVAIPEKYEAQVRPRSGLAINNGLTVLNTPGTIDSDFRAEIGVILINHGKHPVMIERGFRIAQLVIAPVVEAVWGFDDLPESERGEGGFGSTGCNKTKDLPFI